MRKIILNLAVSLDGFIEGPNGEYDWCFTDDDYGMTAFFNDTDTLFIGRKSFELIGNNADTFPEKTVYIFSDTMKNNNELNIINSADFDETVQHILSQSGKNIWLFGGANLVSAFINKNLVTELILSIHPVILGGGKPLFHDIKSRIDLLLIDQQAFDSGLLQVKYALKPKFDMEMLKML
ncbi:dihydrofolate reductase family protein [Mucilaginibacter segetis]|uniref:Dihydrofolate reductase n=1 Tax=Mucilaginibacter segetis TaxID=2793071 RepID=A0A934PT16_9SPHI|nr:dihydrofolate reductase family protein [Mucilaginibacter segetis]MBK0380284.1 dihydrofolate reductase [Mucilaginibacter segetis]